jgi:nicotinamidase-related amidase
MLVIIDMQKQYPASEEVLPEVLKEIKKSKRNNELIAIVNFSGRALGRIYKAVKGARHLVINKHEDNGAKAIFNTLIDCASDNYKLDGPPRIDISKIKQIKVCGVNTSCCVLKTVKSLSYLRFPIKVLSHACANYFPDKKIADNAWLHDDSIKWMKEWKNVKVV